MWLLALLTACDTPDACPEGSVFSPHFGQCIGVEEATAPVRTDDTEPTASTAETGR